MRASDPGFDQPVSRTLGPNYRALEESLVIPMPTLDGLENCHVCCIAGFGCACQRLIDMPEQPRLRFLIPHPARKPKEQHDDIALDTAAFQRKRQAFDQLEGLPVAIDRLGTCEQLLSVFRRLHCVLEGLLPVLRRQPMMGQEFGTCTE